MVKKQIRVAIDKSMAAAKEDMKQNLQVETGSSDAMDFALSSIARSLIALTEMFYCSYIENEQEPSKAKIIETVSEYLDED